MAKRNKLKGKDMTKTRSATFEFTNMLLKITAEEGNNLFDLCSRKHFNQVSN